MSKILETIRRKAAENTNIRLMLPEGHDPRVVKAARQILDQGIARVCLLAAGPVELHAAADEAGVELNGIEQIFPTRSDAFQEYADLYFQLRQAKGMSSEKAQEIMKDPTYFAAMMLRQEAADACISGAANATAHVVRAALQIVGTAEGNSVLSSDFLMIAPDDSRALSYADCAVMPDPNPDQLADIAYATARTHEAIFGVDAVVGMLSFSTKGSASHPLVDKVLEALDIARRKYPRLNIDGELQLDAALIEKVARSKAPGSAVAGKANVLIFPDLNAGNIGYKLTQRLANYAAIGPVFQGLKKMPVCDWIIIHDGARPFLTASLLGNGLEAARQTGSAAAAVPVKDTIKLTDNEGTVIETLHRRNLWSVQTPQIFRSDIITKAFEITTEEVTDDASMVEKIGYKVKLYMGSYVNIKITTPEDMITANTIAKDRMKP